MAGEEDIVIPVAYSGICGSELSGYLGKNSLRNPPLIFGHEFSGTIVSMGRRVKASGVWSAGQRVTANPLITCGQCGNVHAATSGFVGNHNIERLILLLSVAEIVDKALL